jgi:hypothetical protein
MAQFPGDPAFLGKVHIFNDLREDEDVFVAEGYDDEKAIGAFEL